tara:strand:+ start:40 stop:762 length:723 start_codon:yes stop_codon:yes gene_type:complete
MSSIIKVGKLQSSTGQDAIEIANDGHIQNALTLDGGIANAGTITAGTLGSSVVVPASIGASLVLLNTTTISSAVPSVSFDNTLITTTYNAYRIIFTGVSTDASSDVDDFDFYCVFSNDNGSNTINYESVYDYKGINVSSEGTSAGQAGHRLWYDAEGNNADSGGAGYIDFILSPDTATGVDCHSFSSTSVENQNGTWYGYWTIGLSIVQSTSARVNHIKFLEDGGNNLDAGKFYLYGFKL